MDTGIETGERDTTNLASRDQLLLAGVLLLAFLAVVWLSWLLWAYVPMHANVFEAFSVPLPKPAMLALEVSNAFLRHVPEVMLLLSFASLLGVVPLLARAAFRGKRSTARRVLAGAVGVAIMSAGASAFVVWSIHTAYAQAEASGRWKEAARRLDVYRAEHPPKQP